MTKFLLLIAVFIVVYLVIRSGRRAAPPPPAPKQTEDMVRCRVCGIHLPRSESVTSRGEHYCSQEHLRLADSGSSRK